MVQSGVGGDWRLRPGRMLAARIRLPAGPWSRSQRPGRGPDPLPPPPDPAPGHGPGIALPGGSRLVRFDSSLLVERAEIGGSDAAEAVGGSLSDALGVADPVRLHLAARRALAGQPGSLDCVSLDRSRRLAVRLAPDPERLGGGLAVALDLGAPREPGASPEPPAIADQEQRLAVAAGRELARSTDADEARTTTCQALLALSGADHAALLELDPERRELRVTCTEGAEIDPDAGVPADDDSAPARALSGAAAQFVAEPSDQGPAVSGLMRRLGATSALWQPIARGRSVRGIVMLGYRAKVDPMPASTARLLEAVAAESAVAIDRGVAFGRLVSLAATDALTGLPNRRAWEEGLAREIARAGREGTELSIAMMDLDSFKELNDREGHAVGDRKLQSIADLWRPIVRSADLLARYGGDEFGLILPACGSREAIGLMERLRAASGPGTGFSCGLVLWDGNEKLGELVARADQALYRAKAKGPGSVFIGG